MSADEHHSYSVDLTKSKTKLSSKTIIRRGIWQYLVKPLYRIIPGKRSNLRIVILRAMGARIGHSCLIQQRVDILIPWNLVMENYVVIAHDVQILNFTKVTIHSMTVISQHAHLCTGSHDYSHPHFPLVFNAIEIGAECWIASGAFIAPGVTVSRGTVIGANSVVTKDTHPWTVCAGNPCKFLKAREIVNPTERHNSD